jgi:ubiquinone/menaquinone biosynthesis C-methylase UbiE
MGQDRGVSGTDTSVPETVLPAADTALDQPARAFDRIVRTSDAYRAQLRTTIHRMGLTGRKRTLLVLGCGSGAPVQGVVDEAPGWKVVALEESAELVGMARREPWPPDYWFLHGTLGTLDEVLRAEGIEPRFDAILVVFQMRHQRNLDDTLDYLLELLEPGAPLAVHEYSVRGDRAARLRWTAACWLDYLPRIRMRGRVPGMASFLWHSVLRFDSARTFKERMEVSGFTDVRVQTVGGWQEHVLYTFLGRKPEDEGDEPLDDLDAGDPAPESAHDSAADGGTDTPPVASAPVPGPRPSPADRPEWGPVSRRDEPDDEVFDLDEEEDDTGYESRGGRGSDGDPDDLEADPAPTSYADMDEFADNHELDGTDYLDDPREVELFTHADPDAETPREGLPVVDARSAGEEVDARRRGEVRDARPGGEEPAEDSAADSAVDSAEDSAAESTEDPAEGETTAEGTAASENPAAAEGTAATEAEAEAEAPVEGERPSDGGTAPAKARVRNLVRGSRRGSAATEPAGSPWLRRSEREAVRRERER